MANAVDWEFAERIAVRIATRGEVVDDYALARMADDFAEATPKAEKLVGEETGLWSAHGEARARLVSRPDWIRANIASFQRLLKPILGQLDEASDGVVGTFSRRFAGAEVGAVLGWMATRVLGQYDLLLTEDENIVDVSLTVQYVVNDPLKYLVRVRDPENSLDHAVESALRHVVGSSVMDDVITAGRAAIAAEVEDRLQTYLDNYGTGILVSKVNIDESAPPNQVRDAFKAFSAKEL